MLNKKIFCALLAAGLVIPIAASAAFTMGDLNADGRVDAFDLALMKKGFDSSYPVCADLDNDDKLTSADLSEMRDYLLGTDHAFTARMSDGSVRLCGTKSSIATYAPDETFCSAQMAFSTELFQQAMLITPEQNTMVSPLSVSLALAMTANGADGDTLAEMEDVLGSGMPMGDLNSYLSCYKDLLTGDSKSTLHIADSIWYRDDPYLTIMEDFVNTNISYYDAEIYKAPYDETTVEDINFWVKQNTNGMIPKVIEELSPASMVTLINAICFEAEWWIPYSDDQVRAGTFTNADGVAESAEMMHSDEGIYYDFGNATGFAKEYEGNYSFVAILPEEGMTVNEWIADMDAQAVYEEIADPEYITVVTQMPKFSYSTDLELKDALAAMGMPTAFDNTGLADFSNMGLCGGNPTLYISKVIHKTDITVDNAGTKAAAVTAVIMNDCTAVAPEYIKYVTLDRPFVYMIVDKTTNLPIFMGTVQSLV